MIRSPDNAKTEKKNEEENDRPAGKNNRKILCLACQ